jgi:hypothetical protein
MRIRIQLLKLMRIHPDPDTDGSATLTDNKKNYFLSFPRPSSLQCCARNILTVHRETLTQYIIHLKEGGEGSLSWNF